MRYPFVEKAIRHILAQRRSGGQGACPEANELAAYLEGRLSSEEVARFEGHASNCVDCQEKLALSLQLAAEGAGAADKRAVEPQRFTYRTSPIRFALGAAVLLIVGALLFQATKESRRLQPIPQVAHLVSKGNLSGGPEAKLVSPGMSQASAAVGARAAISQPPRATQAPFRSQAADQSSQGKGAPAAASVPPELSIAKAVTSQISAGAGGTKQAAQAEPMEETQKSMQAQLDTEALKMKLAASRPAAASVPLQGVAENLAVRAGTERSQKQAPSTQSLSPEQLVSAEVRSLTMSKAAAKRGMGMTANTGKKVGNRTFYRTADYWVDAECASHGDAPVREITRDSKEYAAILAKEPALAELNSAGIPLLLYWDGTNYLIR
jgi:HAMP domain-containing protein